MIDTQMKYYRMDVSEQELFDAYQEVSEYLTTAPAGTLHIKKNKGHSYYYLREKRKNTWRAFYLGPKKKNLIQMLARKEYYKKLKSVLSEELRVLANFRKKYQPQKKYEVYENLPEEVRSCIEPIFQSEKSRVQSRIDEWKEREGDTYTGFYENLQFQTLRGEYVRSKSECMIADRLYEHRDELLYRYEPELILSNGKQFRPDFSILNCKNGEVFYWEHVGGLEIVDYPDRHVQKMNAYIMEGKEFMRHLLMTYETGRTPLKSAIIEETIRQILQPEDREM